MSIVFFAHPLIVVYLAFIYIANITKVQYTTNVTAGVRVERLLVHVMLFFAMLPLTLL